MQQYLRIITLLTLSVASVACSHVSPRYNTSATNVEEIRQVTKGSDTKIAAGTFTATEAGKSSIVCRAAGNVVPPDSKTYDQFIKDALFDEMKVAGIYDESSSLKFKGNLDSIDFSSNIGAGKWIMKMTFSSDGVEPFTVENTYEFSTNFIADIACEQVAQALPAATQDFIKKFVESAGFKNLVSNKNLVSKK